MTPRIPLHELSRAAPGDELGEWERRTDWYEVGGFHSFFRDMVTVAIDANGYTGTDALGFHAHPLHGGPEQARNRLYGATEVRDLTTTSAAGFAGPTHIGDQFGEILRTRAAVAASLVQEPLPPRGVQLDLPRLTTGGDVEKQASENAGIVEQDPVEELDSFDVETVAGRVDVSQQLLDRSKPGIDQVIANDLGRALAEDLERRVVAHLTSAAATNVTYTDATPTAAEALRALAKGVATSTTAFGGVDHLLALHPRRAAWIASGLGTGVEWPAPIVMSTGIPVLDGSSTNQDSALVWPRSEVILYSDPVRFRVHLGWSGNANLTVRIVADQYVAIVDRTTAAIVKVTGTGFTDPVW